jgi:hypothetical protein
MIRISRQPTLAVITMTLIVLVMFSLGCNDGEPVVLPLSNSQAPMQHMSLFESQIESVATTTDCSTLREHKESAIRFNESSVTSKHLENSKEYMQVADDRVSQLCCS